MYFDINAGHINIAENILEICKNNITLDQKSATRFFKTSRGSYSETDEFLGITVPNLRKIAKIYKNIELETIIELLKSKYNEIRLLATFILVYQYQNGNFDIQKKIYEFYLDNIDRINNWNIVDSGAPYILGHYLFDKDKSLLKEFAISSMLWKRRIAIVSTLYFIRNGNVDDTFEIAKILLKDKHDLIHKATGWMLREAGKKDERKLISFLCNYSNEMPKTMLRYSTERLSSEQKNAISKTN